MVDACLLAAIELMTDDGPVPRDEERAVALLTAAITQLRALCRPDNFRACRTLLNVSIGVPRGLRVFDISDARREMADHVWDTYRMACDAGDAVACIEYVRYAGRSDPPGYMRRGLEGWAPQARGDALACLSGEQPGLCGTLLADVVSVRDQIGSVKGELADGPFGDPREYPTDELLTRAAQACLTYENACKALGDAAHGYNLRDLRQADVLQNLLPDLTPSCMSGSWGACEFLVIAEVRTTLARDVNPAEMAYANIACEAGSPLSCYAIGASRFVAWTENGSADDLRLSAAYLQRACEVGSMRGCIAQAALPE